MKKKIVDEINSLIDKNSELYDNIVLLTKQLQEKKLQIDNLNAEIEGLKKQLIDVQSEQNNSVILTPCVTAPEETVETVAETVENDKNYDTLVNFEPENQSESLNSASAVIGKIVLLCAELCNEFTAFGGQNAKDLVNLALGRTEVFKSEILNIMTENDDFNGAKAEVDLKVAEINEYFDLLKKQL